MSKIIVLGAGMVGSAIAVDLAKDHEVTSSDFNEKALTDVLKRNDSINTLLIDVNNKKQLTEAIAPFDLVICAVPGFLGYETMRKIILAGKNVVDISFFPEDALTLNELAMNNKVTAIVDCGVAPGMDNLILGYHNELMDISYFECLVGGLPTVRKWPFDYKAPFSPVDVIEEYTRPARYVENGNTVIKPALSDVEHIEIEGVGTLEYFNSDGLRTLINTMPHIPNMKEKTLRYPGHADKMRILRDSGFFSNEPIMFQDKEIIPLDFTSKILFDEWKLDESEDELTVMKITIKGLLDGKFKSFVYDLIDRYDPLTNTSSMARTTGYTATAMANFILKSGFSDRGVFPPELVGKHPACFKYVMDYLQERGIHYKRSNSS